jgi:hypothetical protein
VCASNYFILFCKEHLRRYGGWILIPSIIHAANEIVNVKGIWSLVKGLDRNKVVLVFIIIQDLKEAIQV